MEMGLVVHFGGVFPGKEKAALEVFTETSKLYGDKLADGTFTTFEPFFYETGDIGERLGFWLIKGPEEKILGFVDSKESLRLRAKVGQICGHLRFDFVYTGERVLEQVNIFSTVAEELDRTPVLAR